jgi:NAD(P)-dependent dehydrogenase (short-subunit alcohol dehydrogenase family)
MTDFQGKVAVVTGAASGIGLGLAERFARDGMRLVLADIEAAPLEALAARLRASGVGVEALVTDVSDAAAVEALAVRAYDRFGAAHLVCNNAGIVPAGRYRPVWEFTLNDWQWAMGVNLMGVVHGIRSFVPRMRAGGEWGHIVNDFGRRALRWRGFPGLRRFQACRLASDRGALFLAVRGELADRRDGAVPRRRQDRYRRLGAQSPGRA